MKPLYVVYIGRTTPHIIVVKALEPMCENQRTVFRGKLIHHTLPYAYNPCEPIWSCDSGTRIEWNIYVYASLTDAISAHLLDLL